MIERARQAGVYPILAVGEDLASSRRAVDLAERYDSVLAAVGIHPHRAGQFETEAVEVEQLLESKHVVAVGEIGLDYARSAASPEQQREVFAAQVAWARARGLAVSVHNRDADADILSVLGRNPGPGVLHCFSSTWEMASLALEQGLYLSFAGNLTFPRAESLRGVAARVPAERVLVETDSPVLSPQPWRGRRNEPAQILATLAVLASVRETPVEEMSAQIAHNAACLFQWSKA